MLERKQLSNKERDAALREAGYRCAVPTCNTTIAIDVHHIAWVSKGGGNELSNLLALCPTCHALYHLGKITQESIEQWKARLVALNQTVDIKTEIEKRAQEIQSEKKQGDKGEQRKGFALAASEFHWRTCEVGFVHSDARRFVETGYCCFVKDKLAITIAGVADWAISIGKERGGLPVISTQRGLAPFTVFERFDLSNIVIIQIGKIDDRDVVEMLKNYDQNFARFFREPLQTPIRFSLAPFWGDRLGFMHSPNCSKEYRRSIDFQFESAEVAFYLNNKSKDDFLQYVLTPVLSRIEQRGSPVFTEDGQLVGVVNDTILIKGELARRPIISAVFPIKKLFPEEK